MRNYKPNGLILEKWKLIYWFIPKNASSSWKVFFGRHYGYKDSMGSPHAFLNRLPRISPNQQNNYKGHASFAIVRNPFDRLYSAYKSKIYPDRRSRNNVRDGVNINVFGGVAGIRADMCFGEFVRALTRIPAAQAERHWAPQYKHIEGVKVKVFKYETMLEDMPAFLEKHGCPWPDFPERNRSKHRHPQKEKDYRKVYDEQTAALVAEYYKTDFELFGYDKDAFIGL